MHPQERQVLQDFLHQLVQVRGIAKDPDAQAMIATALAQQPDAPYLLVQRALLLEQAINSAREEIATLQNQLRAAPQGSTFLDPHAWGNSGALRAAPAAQPAPVAASYQMPPQVAAPGAGPGFLRGGMGGMGGMLGNLAATAAGVAGGAFLFQGIENLLGHHGGHGLLGQQDDASAHNAFPGLTRPGEDNAAGHHFASSPSPDAPEPSASDASGLLDDQGDNFTDDNGGGDNGDDDGLFS